ncbi:MAG: hypothetical protein L0J47_10710 [Lactococcus lactis]|nr:hypothetical protein [Lactococcus lactis]
MKKYSINEMARLVSADRTNVARYIQRHGLKEMNKDRPHKNSPKYFDETVFQQIKDEYLPKEPQQDDYRRDTASDSVVIELLQEQLAQERHDKQQLQEQNANLLKLLDQQQQLALLSTQKLKELEFKRKEVKESETDQKQPKEFKKEPTKKRKWYHFFKK